VVFFSYATSIVHNFDAVQPVLVEADFCRDGLGVQQFLAKTSDNSPIFVAAASKLFSKSSFTAFWRSMTTWPEVIRCMDALSIALILFDI
jgi:hypothetical protein